MQAFLLLYGGLLTDDARLAQALVLIEGALLVEQLLRNGGSVLTIEHVGGVVGGHRGEEV